MIYIYIYIYIYNNLCNFFVLLGTVIAEWLEHFIGNLQINVQIFFISYLWDISLGCYSLTICLRGKLSQDFFFNSITYCIFKSFYFRIIEVYNSCKHWSLWQIIATYKMFLHTFRISYLSWSRDSFHSNVACVMHIGHQISGHFTMLLIKYWLL